MSAPAPAPVVGVHPAAALAASSRLFDALAAATGARFVPWGPDLPTCDALVTAGGGPMRPGPSRVPTLAFAAEGGPVGRVEHVRVASGRGMDRRLHGLVLEARRMSPALTPAPDEDVLATGEAGPVWTRRRGPAPLLRVRAALPLLARDEVLRDGLRDRRAFALVALTAFLRSLDPGHWSRPRLRAAFVFDDPNLRRITYGHLDYRDLVAHADRHGYHAAMATIPLDGRRAHPAAVRMFRDRPDRLSLVMHGNNHTRAELMQPRDLAAALALGAQALRRIERLERATGLTVDRVMMPPHGLCSRAAVQALGMLGYEALSAIHPEPWTEQPDPARTLAGWAPAELLDGCAVVPRFPLDASATEIALRAFLDQPLVLYAHHGDLASGMEPLAQAAARVNGLGDVQWGSLAELVRENHQLAVHAGQAVVRPWASRLRVTLPPDADALTVETPLGAAADGLAGWSVGDRRGLPHAFGTPVPVTGGAAVDVWLRPDREVDPRTVSGPRRRAWPPVRRRATEVRDRLAPHTARGPFSSLTERP